MTAYWHSLRAFAFAIAMLFASLAHADSTSGSAELKSAFRDANTIYGQQQYSDALRIYESLINAKVESPELFYNAGCAAARLDRPGQAVWHFEQALRIAPRWKDAQENLRLVRATLSPDVVTDSLHTGAPTALLSGREFVAIALASAWLLALSVFGSVWLRRREAARAESGLIEDSPAASPKQPRPLTYLRRVTVVSAILLVASASLAVQRTAAERHGSRVVIVGLANESAAQNQVSVYSGPATTFKTIRELPVGSVVAREEFDNREWFAVSLPGGRTGFVPAAAARIL